jgi:subtilisin family serine protease
MLHDDAKWRLMARGVALALSLVAFIAAPAKAQNFARTPNLNIAPRAPNVTTNIPGPNITPHVDVNIAARTATNGSNVGVRPHLYLRTSPNLYPSCGGPRRDASGECADVLATSEGNGSAGKDKGKSKSGPRRNAVPALSMTSIANDIVAEIDSTSDADALARSHGLRHVESQNFPLIGATIGLFRISDGRSFEAASRDFSADSRVHSLQRNFRYFLQDQKTVPAEGDPAQYALVKLRLPEAHRLAHGLGIRLAVIDSGIDAKHRELAGSVIDRFDALATSEGPHVHGTGIAGAIVAHARLMGSAPAAQLVAIRAFSGAANGAQSNSYVILKSLDYAARQNARIINMSFAGPKDPLIERGIAAAAARNIVMIAAAGNAGAKSPPLYPAANPGVIAVSATDAQDHLFQASNRGSYIAVAAPGAELFLPAPDEKYQMTSGTSFSAAYVSGLAALMLERNPALKPAELRAMLEKSARDLGSPGRDDLFGAGEADALAAVEAVIAAAAVPVSGTAAPSRETTSEKTRESPPIRALTPAMASEKPAN